MMFLQVVTMVILAVMVKTALLMDGSVSDSDACSDGGSDGGSDDDGGSGDSGSVSDILTTLALFVRDDNMSLMVA